MTNRVLPHSKANPGSHTNGVDSTDEGVAGAAQRRAFASAGAVAASTGEAGLVEGNRLKRKVLTQS